MTKRTLRFGDEIRVIAPSGNMTRVRKELFDKALKRLTGLGFKVTFGENVYETDEFKSSSIESRVSDIHDAFSDENVKMILTAIGGFNVNQIIPFLDYELIRSNPKLLCGYSDITALCNVIYAKTGMVTFHGPHFSTFGFDLEQEYTEKYFLDLMMHEDMIDIVPSSTAKEYYVIQEGSVTGELIGGNLCTLNLLQGTPYMPCLKDKILFVEDDNIMGEHFVYEFTRNLVSLLQVDGSDSIKGIIFGRFEESSGLDEKVIAKIVKDKVNKNIPIVFGVDFGHVFPMVTLPIGGRIKLDITKEKVSLEIISH